MVFINDYIAISTMESLRTSKTMILNLYNLYETNPLEFCVYTCTFFSQTFQVYLSNSCDRLVIEYLLISSSGVIYTWIFGKCSDGTHCLEYNWMKTFVATSTAFIFLRVSKLSVEP